MGSGTATRDIGGFHILETRAGSFIELLRRRRMANMPTEILFANTNFIVTTHALAGRLAGPETLIINDGIGLDLASMLLHRRAFPENLAGSDFIPRLLASAAQECPLRLFLLGARPEVVRRAAAYWAAKPNIDVVGAIDGYAGMADGEAVLAAIRASGADLLFVALGDPLQAKWVIENRGRHGVPLVMGVGAFFDFVSGRVGRAPAWVIRIRMEWVYRLLKEPRRLLRRYSVDLVIFFAHCIRTHRAAQRAASNTVGRRG